MDPEDRRTTRRAVLGSTVLALTSLAGCAGLDGTESESTTTSTIRATSTRSTTQTTRSIQKTPTTQQETQTTQMTEPTETTETTREKPGYKDYHWHGQLFFEIDGQVVDFTQSKYNLDNLEKKHPETVYFHFHKSAHGPNEWSNEKRIVTFERGLNLLPDISYENSGGSHVIGYNGTTYHGERSGIDVTIREHTKDIDPTSYEIEHADQFWVSISTKSRSSGTGGTQSGKIMFDINNRRLDFTASKYQRAGTTQFQFKNSEPPYYGWRSQGVQSRSLKFSNNCQTSPIRIEMDKLSSTRVVDSMEENTKHPTGERKSVFVNEPQILTPRHMNSKMATSSGCIFTATPHPTTNTDFKSN